MFGGVRPAQQRRPGGRRLVAHRCGRPVCGRGSGGNPRHHPARRQRAERGSGRFLPGGGIHRRRAGAGKTGNDGVLEKGAGGSCREPRRRGRPAPAGEVCWSAEEEAAAGAQIRERLALGEVLQGLCKEAEPRKRKSGSRFPGIFPDSGKKPPRR